MGDDLGPALAYIVFSVFLCDLVGTLVLSGLLSVPHVPQLVRPRRRRPQTSGSIIPVEAAELRRIAYEDEGILQKPMCSFFLELMTGITVKVRLSDPHSVFFGAPARHKQAALLAISAGIVILSLALKSNPREGSDMFGGIMLGWSYVLVLGWAVPILVMLRQAHASGVFAEMHLNPHQLRYSQDSIASHFHDGIPVTERLGNYSVCACIRTTGYDDDGTAKEELFTLNNRTLFSAIYNGVDDIAVTIVDTDDWQQRFTAQCPWTSIRVREPRLVVPPQLDARSEALHVRAPMAQGNVVLEVDHIINRRPGQEETLCTLLRARLLRLANQIEEEEGARSYARVRMPLQHEEVIRAEVKQIGRERRKRVNIKTISRVFESPRD